MLRIDTNSWHYRLNHKIYGDGVPKSLCPYFWGTLLAIGFLSWLFALLNLIERQNFSLPHFNIGLLHFLERHSTIIRYVMNIGMIGWGGVAFFGFNQPGSVILLSLGATLTFFQVFSKLIFKPGVYKPKEYQEKAPNILIEMAKANHHKICPRLDFVDIEKEDFNDKVRMIEAIKTTRHNLNDLVKNWEKPNEVQSKRLQTQDKTSESS